MPSHSASTIEWWVAEVKSTTSCAPRETDVPNPLAGMALMRLGVPDAHDAVTEPPITMTEALGAGSGGAGWVGGDVGGGGGPVPGFGPDGPGLAEPDVFEATPPLVVPVPGPAIGFAPAPEVDPGSVPAAPGPGAPNPEPAAGMSVPECFGAWRSAARIEDSPMTGV